MTEHDIYLSKLSTTERRALVSIIKSVKDIIPEAQEVITYGMPGFKYHNKYLLAFACFKNHLSLFPGSEVIEKYHDKLSGWKTSKGTIQFSVDHPIPDDILADIINTRKNAINGS